MDKKTAELFIRNESLELFIGAGRGGIVFYDPKKMKEIAVDNGGAGDCFRMLMLPRTNTIVIAEKEYSPQGFGGADGKFGLTFIDLNKFKMSSGVEADRGKDFPSFKRRIRNIHSKMMWGLTYFPRNRLFGSGSNNHDLKITTFDGVTNLVDSTTDTIRCCLGLEDDNLLVSSCNDGLVAFSDFVKQKRLKSHRDHGSYAITLCHEKESNLVFSGGYDKKIRLYSSSTPGCIKTLESETGTYPAFFSSECIQGKHEVILGSANGDLLAFDVRKLDKPRIRKDGVSNRWIYCIQPTDITKDRILVGGNDKKIRILKRSDFSHLTEEPNFRISGREFVQKSGTQAGVMRYRGMFSSLRDVQSKEDLEERVLYLRNGEVLGRRKIQILTQSNCFECDVVLILM